MTDFEKLVIDYNKFEFDYDLYGYRDAFSDEEDAIAVFEDALANEDLRQQIVNRLQEIANDNEEYKAPAQDLIARIAAL